MCLILTVCCLTAWTTSSFSELSVLCMDSLKLINVAKSLNQQCRRYFVLLESTWTVDPTVWAGSRCQWQLYTQLIVGVINVFAGLLIAVDQPQVVGELSQLPPLLYGAKKDEEPNGNDWLVSIHIKCGHHFYDADNSRSYLKVVVLMIWMNWLLDKFQQCSSWFRSW